MGRPKKQTVDYSWWVNTMKARVRKELNTRLDICENLGIFNQRFISWCAEQRLIYEADIDEEYREFKSKFIESRLENVDIELYYRLRKGIFERDNYTCKYCGQIGGRLEIDHAIPIARGGDSKEENLVTSCYRCNRSKRIKTPCEFEAWRLNHA